MAETTDDDKNRGVFFSLQGGDRIMSRKNRNAIKWAQTTFMELELKNKNLSETILTISKSPQLALPDSDDEIYERRRRERLLDEVTLICVSKEIEIMVHDCDDQLKTGFRARDIANEIWAGINEFDLQL